MHRDSSRSIKFALLCAAACALCAAASCSQDGVTTNCPALPRYDSFPLGDASIPDAMSGDSAASKEELAAAIAKGCATDPGGSAAAGKAGSGGKLGSGGEGGSNSADSAGAAGRN